MRKKVLVRAPVLSRTGYGEHARFVLRSLREHEDRFDIFLLNTPWGQNGAWIKDDNEERQWIDYLLQKTQHHQQNKGSYDLSIQVSIPNEWERLAPMNIGVTAGIETTKVSPIWLEKANAMDSVVTISEHSKNVFLNTKYQGTLPDGKPASLSCQVPINIVHYPVREYEQEEMELNLETDFNFLLVAQWGPRKNIENTIRWFVREFKDESVGLVVKAFKSNNSLYDKHQVESSIKNILNEESERKCKVYLLHGDLTEEQITGLYNHSKIKALVSLTHGEGFGLPIYEAAYNGLPVIAPDWSGHLDFLYKREKDKKGKEKNKPYFSRVDYDLAPIPKHAVWEGVLQADSLWCYPKEASFKSCLRKVFKDNKRFQSQAKKLKAHLCKKFSAKNQYEKMADAIWKEQEEQIVEFG